jgi:hypothetical protein
VAEIRAGKAVGITPQTGSTGTVTVTQVVADGQAGPTVTDQQGGVVSLAATDNVVAAVLPATDHLNAPGVSGGPVSLNLTQLAKNVRPAP